jgi:hypothetical protein
VRCTTSAILAFGAQKSGSISCPCQLPDKTKRPKRSAASIGRRGRENARLLGGPGRLDIPRVDVFGLKPQLFITETFTAPSDTRLIPRHILLISSLISLVTTSHGPVFTTQVLDGLLLQSWRTRLLPPSAGLSRQDSTTAPRPWRPGLRL